VSDAVEGVAPLTADGTPVPPLRPSVGLGSDCASADPLTRAAPTIVAISVFISIFMVPLKG
jgi:hypothetical protein